MLEIEKVIELLSDCCDRGMVTFDEDFKDAVRVGKKVLTLVAYDTSHKWDDESLELLLGVERRK